jgi:hypothetical protein
MPYMILTASASLGGGTLTAWKRRSSERSFLDRLAELGRRGRADALNLAARKRGLQDVGGVERAFGRTGADQRVQLVDEDDGVLILHQLLHDGLQALFELAAILGAGDDQRKIERQNALVGQERRHVAIGDASAPGLRRWPSCRRRARRSAPDCSWCGGRGSAPRAPARNRGRSADRAMLSMAACVRSRLNSPAASFPWDDWPRLSPTANAATLRGWCRKAQAALMQDFGGEALLFAQQPSSKMLGADVLVIQALGFFGAVGENALALVAQRQIDRSRNLSRAPWCGLQSACGWNRRPRATAETDWPAACLRAAGRAADARSRCTGCRTGWPRTARRR